MSTLYWLYALLAAHYIAVAGGALVVISTVANQLFPDGKLPKWLSITVDLLSLAAKPGHVGLIGPLSAPGFISRNPGASTIPTAHTEVKP